MRRLSLLAAVCLLTAASVSACAPPARSKEPLRVSQNLVMLGSTRFVVRGAVDYILPFYEATDGEDPALASVTNTDFADRVHTFAVMRKDGINTVRIPLSLTGFLDDTYHLGGQSGYLDRLVATVKAADRAGLHTVLSWWDSLGWAANLAKNYSQLWPMDAAVLRAIGNDADVIYEPFNEPNGIDWPTWETVARSTITEWRRALHYQGVLVLDTIGYSWDFSPAYAASVQEFDASLMGRRPEIVFANHRYPNGATCLCGPELQDFSDSVGRWVGRFPILGTEYGIYSAGYPPGLPWMKQLLEELSRLETEGLNGGIAFVWNWVDPNTLTSDRGTHLTAYGDVVLKGLWASKSH